MESSRTPDKSTNNSFSRKSTEMSSNTFKPTPNDPELAKLYLAAAIAENNPEIHSPFFSQPFNSNSSNGSISIRKSDSDSRRSVCDSAVVAAPGNVALLLSYRHHSATCPSQHIVSSNSSSSSSSSSRRTPSCIHMLLHLHHQRRHAHHG